jgi:hypothetical protein
MRTRQVKDYTDDQLAELIDQSLKQTAKDVREGRIPLDGRVRFPPRDASDDRPTAPVQQPAAKA